jgi:hypothetical protein
MIRTSENAVLARRAPLAYAAYDEGMLEDNDLIAYFAASVHASSQPKRSFKYFK